jgi:hypothetical protein
MLVLRRVFQCKYGKAGEVAELTKTTSGKLAKYGFAPGRIMTDFTGQAHSVVWETQFNNLKSFEEARSRVLASEEYQEWFSATADIIESATRDFWKVEE